VHFRSLMVNGTVERLKVLVSSIPGHVFTEFGTHTSFVITCRVARGAEFGALFAADVVGNLPPKMLHAVTFQLYPPHLFCRGFRRYQHTWVPTCYLYQNSERRQGQRGISSGSYKSRLP
jgi:hypothetical protein